MQGGYHSAAVHAGGDSGSVCASLLPPCSEAAIGAGAHSVARPLRGHPPGRTCTATRASAWEAAEAVGEADADAAAAPGAGWPLCPQMGEAAVLQPRHEPPRALRASRDMQVDATQGLRLQAPAM